MRTLVLLATLALLPACGPTSPGAGTSAGTSGNADPSGAPDPTSSSTALPTATDASTADPPTTDPPTTAPPTTAPSTTDPPTTDPPTTDATTADTTTTALPPPRPCIPDTDWNEHHFDCLLDWPTATQLQASGPAASLGVVTRIYFGVRDEACIDGLDLEPLRIGDPEAPDALLFRTLAECGPEQWPGVYELDGQLADQTPFVTTMTIEGFAGDWHSPDPVDPPRIFGSFTGDLVGPFEAVHCAAIDLTFDDCG